MANGKRQLPWPEWLLSSSQAAENNVPHLPAKRRQPPNIEDARRGVHFEK